MYDRDLGLYLLGRGLLTKEQYFSIAANRAQYRIGDIAIDLGLMTNEQVKEVNHEQRRKDEKFGLIACEKGYMTNEQLEQVLFKQSSRISLPNLITQRGYLTHSRLEEAIADYKKECALVHQDDKGFQGLDFEILVRIILDFSSGQCNECCNDLYYDYIALLLRNIVRFLNEEPAIWTNYEINNLQEDDIVKGWTVEQIIKFNDHMLQVLLLSDEEPLLDIARHYSKESIHTFNEYAVDCVSEFLNVTNGLFAVNLSQIGYEPELTVPKASKGRQRRLGNGCVIPISLNAGRMYLVLSTLVC